MRASGKVIALDVPSAKTDIAERLMSAYFNALSIPDKTQRNIALAKWAMKADRYKRRFISSPRC